MPIVRQVGAAHPLLDAACSYDTGDVAWVMTATVLVLGMVPGLAFFEAGMLRRKNSVSIITQALGGLVLLACLWVLFGYSVTFGEDHSGLIGGWDHLLFYNIGFADCVVADGMQYSVPTATFAIFQMMFACVTPLLITGSVAERMRWKPYVVFTLLWEVLVYYPLAHWIWGRGWLDRLGTQDFAGGIVIHTSSGIAALIVAALLGPRAEYERYRGDFPHSDVRVAVIGAAFLWTGWFGFNAGSAYGANAVAIHAIINTQIGACFGGTVWLLASWQREKPSALALINGAVAGMAGITPASGYISPPSAVVLSLVLGLASFLSTSLLKRARIDDALEVSCVHGLTGIIGSLAIGFCGNQSVNPSGQNGLLYGGGLRLLGVQTLGVLVALVYSGVLSLALLLAIARHMPLRARPEHEAGGLDYWHHRLDVVHPELCSRAEGPEGPESPEARTEGLVRCGLHGEAAREEDAREAGGFTPGTTVSTPGLHTPGGLGDSGRWVPSSVNALDTQLCQPAPTSQLATVGQ